VKRFVLPVLLLGLIACTGEEEPVPPPAPEVETTAPMPEAIDPNVAPAMAPARLELAIELAVAIKANPKNGSDLLVEKNLTQESFEALLYEVAKDPGAATIYAERIQ
jgi:hypothetical protein